MQNQKLTSRFSFKLLFSSLSLPSYLHLSLILIIFLSWNSPSCVVVSCPTVCQCILSRQEMICHKGKLVDITVDLYSSLKRLTLDSVTGLDVLSLGDLEPVKDTLVSFKIKDSSVKSIPTDTFTGFSQIEELDVSGNELITLEEGSFSGLSSLKSLNLSGNQLLSLGTSLSPLGHLESLDISSNSLQKLPEGVFINQTSLMRLYLDGNPLKSLDSQALIGLDKMRELYLRDCSLASLEKDLFLGKEELRDLDLGQNKLTSFLSPSAMSLLSHLSFLYFDNNEIQTLSQHLFKDLHLQFLDLSFNRINSIDPTAFVNSSIKVLDLSYNMIFSLGQLILKPLSVHITSLSLAGNPMGKLSPDIFSDLQLLESLNISSCRLNLVHYGAFQDLKMLNRLDLSHNNLHSLTKEMIEFIDKLHIVYLHQNAWVCDCHIKPLSKWLTKTDSALKMHCPPSRSQHQDCKGLRCAAPSQLADKQLVDLVEEDVRGCQGEEDSDHLPATTQGAIVASCMGFAIILLIITVYLWKRGKTGRGLKRVCAPSDAESSHVVDEDSKVPPLSNCDRASLNESDHSFVVRHYFDTLVTDPKLMSRTSDSEEPTSPKERDSLYSSQPSLYSNPSAPLGIESTV